MFAMIDASLLMAAGASFVLGLMGYIIVRFWVVPIVRYRLARRKLKRELSACLHAMDQPANLTLIETQGQDSDERLQRARQHAMELVNGYTHQIPVWYRLLLDSRGESPSKASDRLSNLDKIKDLQQRRQRIRNAVKAMGLE